MIKPIWQQLVTGMGVMALATMGGWFAYHAGVNQEKSAVTYSDAQESQIMAHVVDRNPNATIKDFEGFPRALLLVARQHRLDYRLIMALIDQESRFDPQAIGKSGEIGLMQLMPETARLTALGTGIPYVPAVKKLGGGYTNLGNLADPKINMKLGVAFLAGRIEKFGNIPTGLRAYNRGDANAKIHRPLDRYAESVALKYVSLVPRLP
jgi:soluble lytic murein transglycosylase-like protein